MNMGLLIAAFILCTGWILLLIKKSNWMTTRDQVLRRRLRAGLILGTISVSLWLVWFGIQSYAPPITIKEHWGMVFLCVLGLGTSITSGITFQSRSIAGRGLLVLFVLLMMAIYLLSILVSLPVS